MWPFDFPLARITGNDGRMRIRAAELQDSHQILHIIKDAITANAGDHYSREQIQAWADGFAEESIVLAIEYTESFVAETDGQIVGFGNIEISDEVTTQIHLLYVSSQYQRRGVGTLLIKELESQARSAGKMSVEADVSLQAHGLFLKAGYSSREDYIKIHHGFEFPNSWVDRKL